MFFKRQSLARKPSLSTINSFDSTQPFYVSSNTDRKRPTIATDRYPLAQGHPYIPSPATLDQAHLPSYTVMSPNMPRPALTSTPSSQTRYIEMLLDLDRIPRIYNILAATFTWVLLAAFLIIPGTYTSFKDSDAFKNAQQASENKGEKVAKAILDSAANVGLLWLSVTLAGIAGLGCCGLWARWRNNYVWLINKVFTPALMNSVAGLLTTMINVYTAQKGVWSVTAKITASVTGSLIAITGTLFCCYNFWMLEKVRDAHEATYSRNGEKQNF